MKALRILRNYRVWILYFVGIIAIMLALAEPTQANMVVWLPFYLATKGGAICLLFIICKLYNFWRARGELNEIDELLGKEE